MIVKSVIVDSYSAAEAGISRQAIYQKHFNNFEDIIDYIHKETDQQIFNNFNNYCPERDGDPITFLADHILPLIYEKREVVGTLYNSQPILVGRSFFVRNILSGY